ncbi:2-phospho-L-lactate guanylyltransferase [Halosegnis marinus]|uniref:2-phospho-L-lactate guanylyltransferase n=1 Tax=Halosegnis marinus TaxID=3034023 RepID=A0ABD5ZLK1_9EURY|nr:2-phospho-L-lactate guanylyltransferase [Halosegnis sp. DT85]
MRVLVPFGARDPKRRLAPVLDADERRAFADAMLADVLDALADHDPVVLADASVEADAPVVVDERPLGEAVNAELAASAPTAVVMADLPLLTRRAVERLFAPDADVTLAPGLGGGTNALVARDPDFRTDYHGASVRDHRRAARALGASVATVDSFRLAVDADEPSDLAEVLLHGEGAAADWLRDHGGRVETTDGRVRFAREEPATGT